MTPRIRRSLWTATLVLWTFGVGAGLSTLWSYEHVPGPSADAPARWPQSSRLPRPDGRPVLILALHPQCPCSRATVAELARLVAHTAAPFDIEALVVASPGFDEALIHSTLWKEAAAIPGVHVVRDTGGEAHGFGARVSGQVLAYDGAGRLQFNGGITGSRGHEGDNPGRAAVEAMLAGRRHPVSSYVFGCLLFDGDGNAAPVEQDAI
jgi:hypothetical protein